MMRASLTKWLQLIVLIAWIDQSDIKDFLVRAQQLESILHVDWSDEIDPTLFNRSAMFYLDFTFTVRVPFPSHYSFSIRVDPVISLKITWIFLLRATSTYGATRNFNVNMHCTRILSNTLLCTKIATFSQLSLHQLCFFTVRLINPRTIHCYIALLRFFWPNCLFINSFD